jgi:hypothetical protein
MIYSLNKEKRMSEKRTGREVIPSDLSQIKLSRNPSNFQDQIDKKKKKTSVSIQASKSSRRFLPKETKDIQ